jgi:type VI protein secretion system component VasK
MLYQVLAIAGGLSSVALLIAFLWARAAAARARKEAAEQEQFAAQLKASFDVMEKARAESERRYEDLVAEWRRRKKELEDALEACSHDPDAVRARLRGLLTVSTPPPGGGGETGGTLPP